ncbi:MAG: carboxypeptidase-like regulatory domain-containing protein [Bacteroidales bacterium]
MGRRNRPVRKHRRGPFRIHPAKPGDYTVKAEKSGYKSYTSDTLKVEENHKITLDINLEPLT